MAASVCVRTLNFRPHLHAGALLFSGARSSGISFNMLHRTDKVRGKTAIYLSAGECGRRSQRIVKGYEFRKDEYIVIEPEEIKKIEPQTAKTMEILEFVKAGDVDPVYFESSYYMMPEEAGASLCAADQGVGRKRDVAIAKITCTTVSTRFSCRPHAGGMMLHTM